MPRRKKHEDEYRCEKCNKRILLVDVVLMDNLCTDCFLRREFDEKKQKKAKAMEKKKKKSNKK